MWDLEFICIYAYIYITASLEGWFTINQGVPFTLVLFWDVPAEREFQRHQSSISYFGYPASTPHVSIDLWSVYMLLNKLHGPMIILSSSSRFSMRYGNMIITSMEIWSSSSFYTLWDPLAISHTCGKIIISYGKIHDRLSFP